MRTKTLKFTVLFENPAKLNGHEFIARRKVSVPATTKATTAASAPAAMGFRDDS